jgi:O-antigen ligase
MQTLILHRDTVPLLTATGLLAAAFGMGLIAPPLFMPMIYGLVAAGIVFLAFRFPTTVSVAWLLVTSLSLEMTLNDLIGDGVFQPTIAAIKGVELVLAAICALRYGLRIDLLCPAGAFIILLGVGLAHGLHPGLTAGESVRSAIGSVTPFAFCLCRLPRGWPQAILRASKWAPVVAVVAALPFALCGIRPLFIDSGGARLAGLGHPAFLAGVCLPAVYACLIALFREGRRGDLLLLFVNGLILLLTGARAPLAYAAIVSFIAMLSIRSTAFPMRTRLVLMLAAATLAPLAAGLASSLSDIRVFNLFLHEATNLSGRDLLWPEFERAMAASPWVGWGLGAGNTIIPAQGALAQELHTWAAHNEYLRIGVEGGQLGRGLVIGMLAAWVIVRSRRIDPAARRIIRLAFVAMAAHAMTDNLLISTPACVMFAFVTAVFAERDAGGDAREGVGRPRALTRLHLLDSAARA